MPVPVIDGDVPHDVRDLLHLDLLPLHGGDAAVPHYLGLVGSLPRIEKTDQ